MLVAGQCTQYPSLGKFIRGILRQDTAHASFADALAATVGTALRTRSKIKMDAYFRAASSMHEINSFISKGFLSKHTAPAAAALASRFVSEPR
jgi:hypothetical protein